MSDENRGNYITIGWTQMGNIGRIMVGSGGGYFDAGLKDLVSLSSVQYNAKGGVDHPFEIVDVTEEQATEGQKIAIAIMSALKEYEPLDRGPERQRPQLDYPAETLRLFDLLNAESKRYAKD